MPGAPISDQVALRIGLAARALPDTDAARLTQALARAVGLPPTAEKLAALRPRELGMALDGEGAQINRSALMDAIAILKGERELDDEPPPAIEPYGEGDLPGSIRVACASNTGERLDGHFGSARRFLIYQVSSTESRLVAVRVPNDSRAEDRNAYRAALIADCQVLCVASIGGPAAAKVIKAGIHPIKFPDGGSARDQAIALQGVLARGAPPWLAKVMGHQLEERVRFARGASESP